jgi:hypothetical protein
MKLRASPSVLIFLFVIAAGSICFFSVMKNPTPLQLFPAVIKRDCAPWDGSAFTISMPFEESVINISIYRSPNIRLPVTFSIPDETVRDGNALLLRAAGFPEQLTGKVWFPYVDEGKTVEGRFSLTSESGQQFDGKFVAEWENQAVYCG